MSESAKTKSTDSDDLFKPAREMLAMLKADEAAEIARAQTVIDKLVTDGLYNAADHRRHMLNLSLEPIRREMFRLAKMLPPFATIENGVRFLHPVTDENEHILLEMVHSAPDTSVKPQ